MTGQRDENFSVVTLQALERSIFFFFNFTSFTPCILIQSIYFPRNALRNTTHLPGIITTTCFGTQVSSSGSYNNKGVPANMLIYFDVLLTVHLSITLVNDRLDPQFFYFTIRLLQSSTYFEQRRAHQQEVKLY